MFVSIISVPKTLVSDMKKTQTYIRKLRTLSDFPGSSLVEDTSKLNLSKYVDEVLSYFHSEIFLGFQRLFLQQYGTGATLDMAH
jgi:hypothetical protein